MAKGAAEAGSEGIAFWIFAYGSLMWNPEFRPVETRRARLRGWRRSFSMWSVEYRGTVEHPGLVLALDRAEGGACEGLALAVGAGEDAGGILAALRDRELSSSAYEERTLPAVLDDGRQVPAIAYVITARHPLHCPDLSPERQAEIIASARGERGPNRDYLENTVAHLRAIGIRDPELEHLAGRVAVL